MNKSFYIFTDAHISGSVAIIAQGKTLSHAKPVAVSSRTTNMAEKKYPQLDLEAMAISFALRILAGAPDITILTDHKPLCATFNRKKPGSVQTDCMKLRQQYIVFSVAYQKGKINPTDYLSRRGKSFTEIPIKKRKVMMSRIYYTWFPRSLLLTTCGYHILQEKPTKMKF